jgi:hypothetical protein
MRACLPACLPACSARARLARRARAALRAPWTRTQETEQGLRRAAAVADLLVIGTNLFSSKLDGSQHNHKERAAAKSALRPRVAAKSSGQDGPLAADGNDGPDVPRRASSRGRAAEGRGVWPFSSSCARRSFPMHLHQSPIKTGVHAHTIARRPAASCELAVRDLNGHALGALWTCTCSSCRLVCLRTCQAWLGLLE